jgi:hypothetical protein
MPKPVVEIHVPLIAAPGLSAHEYQFPWIDEVEELLADLDEDAHGAQEFDDGEEWGDAYIFFITGSDEDAVLTVASDVAELDGVPAGAIAVVTHEDAAEFGLGRRVQLPLR